MSKNYEEFKQKNLLWKTVYKLSEEKFEEFCKLRYNYNLSEQVAYAKILEKGLFTKSEEEKIYSSLTTQATVNKENYESAYATRNKDFRKIWNFLIAEENKNKSWSAEEIARELVVSENANRDTILKRVSDLKICGLIQAVEYDSYKNSAGRVVKFAKYKSVCYNKFEEIASRLNNNIKAKDLKVNTTLRNAMNMISDIIRDRKYSDEERYRAIASFTQAMVDLVDNNSQVKEQDFKNRFRTLPNSYTSFDNFIKDFEFMINRKVKDTTSEIDDQEDYDKGLFED